MSFTSVHPAYKIYAQELWSLGHGHAMWIPDPSPTFGEVHLGDVGYLREGHFSFLFNCMCDAHDPVNKRGVPPDFAVFTPPNPSSIQDCPDIITQSELHSKSIRSLAVSVGASVSETLTSATAAAGLRYQCMQTSGALLFLKDNAHKRFLDCDRHIKTYMAAHIEQWHDFATAHLGIDVKQEDIIFISGCTKTTVWAEAAFHGRSSQGELVVSGGWPVPVSGEFRVSLSRSADASVFSRTGPTHRVKAVKDTETVITERGSDANHADQCIFLNYHKAKQRARWRPPKVMKAAAGPHDPGSGGDADDSFTSLIASSSESEASSTTNSTLSEYRLPYNSFSPVDSLIDYIFMNSDADIACVSDTELTCIFPGEDLPEDIVIALELLQVPIIIGNQYAEINVQNLHQNALATVVEGEPVQRDTESSQPQPRVEPRPADNYEPSLISFTSSEGTLVDDEFSNVPYSYIVPLDVDSESKMHKSWEMLKDDYVVDSVDDSLDLPDSYEVFEIKTLSTDTFSMPPVMSNTDASRSRGETLTGKVTCSVPFTTVDGRRLIMIGCAEGVWIGFRHDPQSFRRVLHLKMVTQCAILEDYGIVLILADKSLYAYRTEALVPSSPPQSAHTPQSPQKLSGTNDVQFFSVGNINGQTLVIYMKKKGPDSVFRVLEPVVGINAQTQAVHTFNSRLKLRSHRSEWFRVFRDFYLPQEAFDLIFLKMRVVVLCAKGFEILDLTEFKSVTIPQRDDPRLEKLARRWDRCRPMAMFRATNDEFLLCYNEFGLYVDRHGDPSRPNGIIEWDSTADHVAWHHPYILLFNNRSIEIRHVETGRVAQIIPGNNIRCIWDSRGITGARPATTVSEDEGQENGLHEPRVHGVMNASDALAGSHVGTYPSLARPVAQHVFELIPTIPL